MEVPVLDAFATPRHRRLTTVFLVVSCLCATGAAIIGLDGNTPANLLALVAAGALVLTFVHPWRRPGDYAKLVYASGLGFAGLVVLHNLFEAAAAAVETVSVLAAILRFLGAASFLGAVFLCPLGFILGLAGVLITFLIGSRGDRDRGPSG
jgi:hypothetical protein